MQPWNRLARPNAGRVGVPKLFGNFADVAGSDPEIKKRKLAIVGVIGGDANSKIVDVLSKELRRKNEPVIEAVAFQGPGVFETLKEIARQVLTDLKQGG